VTAPTFILSPVSLVEYSQFWYGSHDLFIGPSKEKDPLPRFVLVLKWFIGTLRAQYCSRNEKFGSEKKPLNPFLGEVFVGTWNEGHEEMVLASEQVSHHPPVTGYSLWNDHHGVYLEGYNDMKARISISTCTISVKRTGRATFYIKNFDETFIITLPALHIAGILFGAPYVELEGQSFIESSSGYQAVIEYSGKGYFSGKKNTFDAKVYKIGTPDSVIYNVNGQWSGTSKIRDERYGVETDFLDASKLSITTLAVKPEQEQHELESRRAWAKVAAAIRKGDYDMIHQEKSKRVFAQRELRKAEQAAGSKWRTMWFEERTFPLVEKSDLVYLQLCKSSGVEPETGWRFVREMYDAGTVKPISSASLN
jgi:hypothetical protein